MPDKRRYAGVVVDTAGVPIANAIIAIVYREGASSFQDGTDSYRFLDSTDISGSFSAKVTLRRKEHIQYFIFQGPPPSNLRVKTYQYTEASHTDIKVVLK